MTFGADDESPFAASDPLNDPFNDQAPFAPLLASQLALDPLAPTAHGDTSAESAADPGGVDDPINPMSADSDADADLPRGARAQQFRQSRRLQVSMAFPALALIALGGLLIAAPVWLTPIVTAGLAVGAGAISLLARFWLNGRRERGLCFLGLTVLLWSLFLTAVVARNLLLDHLWPILLMALGLALLCTFLFERAHERNVILPGLVLILAGAVALAFTWPLLPGDWLGGVQSVLIYWPLLCLALAMLLLPRALRRRMN